MQIFLNKSACCLIRHVILKCLRLSLLPVFIFAFSVTTAQAQKRSAYLLINTKSAPVKCDSASLSSLRSLVKNSLLKKKIVLLDNSEIEKIESGYIYLNVLISDSLRISAYRLSNLGSYTSRYNYRSKAFIYSGWKDIKRDVSAYIKSTIK